MVGGGKRPRWFLGPRVVPGGKVQWPPLACPVGRPVPSLAAGVETKSTCSAEYGQPVYGLKMAELVSRRQGLCICAYFKSVEMHQVKVFCVFCRNVQFCSQHFWMVFWVGEWMHLAVPVKCWLTKVTVEVLNTTVKRIHSFDKKNHQKKSELVEMLEMPRMSYRGIFLTEYGVFLEKKTLSSPASLVSGVSSLLYRIFMQHMYIWCDCHVCWKQTLWILRDNAAKVCTNPSSDRRKDSA